MPKHLVAAIAAITAIAFASVAVAQTQDASMKVSLSPKKAGTKRHPRNSSLKLTIANNDVHKTLRQLDVQLPKTVAVSGKGLMACKEPTLQSDGPSACPKGSIAGKGIANAAVGVDQPAPVPLQFDVTAVVVGKNGLDFFLHGTNLAVNATATGRIRKTSKGPKLVVKIPQQAQQPTPGVYAGLVDLTATIAKKSGTHKLIATTGCRHHKQKFSTVLHFAQNPARPAGTAKASASSTCS